MFSFLKTAHRRSDSTPGSPKSGSWQSPGRTPSPASDQIRSPVNRFSALPSPLSEPSPVPSLPPTLPPIPRVASQHRHGSSPPAIREGPWSRPIPQQDHDNVPWASATAPGSTPSEGSTARRKPDTGLRINTTDAIEAVEPLRKPPPPRLDLNHRIYESPRDEVGQSGYRRPGTDRPLQEPAGNPSHPFKDRASRPRTPPGQVSRSNQLQVPNGSSQRAPSPSSSLSSVQKSTPSSTFEPDPSPASSRSAQPSTASTSRTRNKIDLLNPLSLIRRRRTAHGLESLTDGGNGNNGLNVPAMRVPEDYDPRIKGKGVHDFSQPRVRRNPSTNDADSISQLTVGDASPVEEYHRRSSISNAVAGRDSLGVSSDQRSRSSERRYTAVFTEHFDEDNSQASSAVQRESLADPTFLARISRRLDFDAADFATKDPVMKPRSTQSPPPPEQRVSKSTFGTPSVRNSSDQSTVRSSFSQDTKATSPPGSPSPKQSQRQSALDVPFQISAVPKKLTASSSKASRFSFQFNSDGTIAEEKALEEKGKQKAAAKNSLDNDRYDDMDDEDQDAFDDFDDGSYEEDIPMVGGDEGFYQHDSTAALNLAPADESTWNSSTSSQPTLRPASDTKDGPHSSQEGQTDVNYDPTRQGTVKSSGSGGWYFDDGSFNEPSPNGQREHDESMFDSPTDDRYQRPTLDEALSKTMSANEMEDQPTFVRDTSNDQSVTSQSLGWDPAPQVNGNKLSTQNLQNLDNTLASLQRPPSVDTTASNSDIGWYGQYNYDSFNNAVSSAPYGDDTDYDGLEDDPMISEANAEILASDDAEYYGQEFGFYGQAQSNGGHISNGGVFGAPLEIYRSKSGRVLNRDANLTPITERSEYSRRTSFTSLHHPGSSYSIGSGGAHASTQHLPSPGLRDLAEDIMREEEDNMSLSQLIQMRRTTFGAGGRGSSVSTTSSLSSPINTSFSPSMLEEETTGQQEQSAADPVQDYESQSKVMVPQQDPNAHGNRMSQVTSPLSISPIEPSSASTGLGIESHFPQTDSKDVTPRPPVDKKKEPRRSTSPTPITRRRKDSSMSSTSSTSPPISPTPQFSNVPALPSHLMQTFAARPPASSASYAERERAAKAQRLLAAGTASVPEGRTVTSYEEDPVTHQMYLARYKKLSSGEYQFLGREISSEGAAPFD